MSQLSSDKFSSGSILYSDTTGGAEVTHDNSRFWERENHLKAVMIWKQVSDIGTKGGEDDTNYIRDIMRFEEIDQFRIKLKDASL